MPDDVQPQADSLQESSAPTVDPSAEVRGLELPTRFKGKENPGSMPGIELSELQKMPSLPGDVFISCIDYSAERVHVQQIDDIEDFIIHHRPEWSRVRWINVDGLTNMDIIHAVAEKYDLHPLAIEDLLHVGQRPKIDSYGGSDDEHQARLCVICRMLQLRENHLQSEQVTIFIGQHTILTFQEAPGDVWDPIRQRINTRNSRLRGNDASFLVYALIDAIVDHCFPILEHYGDRLEELEDMVLQNPSRESIASIHELKRQLLLLRRAIWPMREVVHTLQREPHDCISEQTRTYLRDVYDHTVQVIDIIETYREVATGLAETYMTTLSNRMNEIMKVLTIIGTIFIPLTFLAGVYGMNFHTMPEMHSEWAYPWAYPIGFWGLCIGIALGLLVYFRRRGWI